MRVSEFNEKERRLVISARAAKVVILPGGEVEQGGSGWVVDWEVIQSAGYGGEASRGRRHFTNDELASAFGLSEDSGDCGQWLLDLYGAHSAEQGKYIRWKEFLNIPCPGTGHDGDPSVSVHIDDEMQEKVRQLLS